MARYFALPADMAPHIPSNVSWEEAGSIQPLAVSHPPPPMTHTDVDCVQIGVQIGKRVNLRAHQTIAIM